MWPCSSWVDPDSKYHDREKPEVAAPGTNINSTTTSSPWIRATGSGTSYSAPMATGVAALLMNRNISLQSSPEAIKAILMATALHNIEGSSRLSEYDGAGGIVADEADNVARGIYGGWGYRSYTCSTINPLTVASPYLTAGTRTRVVIAWPTDPSYGSYTTRPSSDLGLYIDNSLGYTIAVSDWWDNTYEIVDFVPSQSGYYKIQVYKFRCDLSPSRLAWAWYHRN